MSIVVRDKRIWITGLICLGSHDYLGPRPLIVGHFYYYSQRFRKYDKKFSWCWQTRATRSEVTQGHQTWYTIRYFRHCFLIVCYTNFVPKTRRFSDNRLQKMLWPWNPGQRSLNLIGTNTDQSATYDFLLTLHCNHGPISHLFRDRRRFQSKIEIFPHPRVFNASAELTLITLGIGYRRKGSKTRLMGLPDGQKDFKACVVTV